MPTSSEFKIPAPSSWIEFQRITLDALAIRWKSPNLQINGRQGQAQHGVDICGTSELGRNVGIECKHYSSSTSFTKAFIDAAIAQAETFTPKLAEFYIATSTARDAKIQGIVREITEARLAAQKFPVGILFWDDLYSELVKQPLIFAVHYLSNFHQCVPVNIQECVPPDFLDSVPGDIHRVVPRHI